MAAVYRRTDDFRGADFLGVDLAGATFRDCDLGGVRIVGSDITGVRISGYAGEAAGVTVDDVDVSAYVSAELDRRHPERVQLREARTVEELRIVWATVEDLWSRTRTRAEQLPEELRHERVDGEWSVVETLRHLVFAVDVWMGRMVRGEDRPFHPAGLPPTDYPDAGAAELGIDLAARPSYEEAVALHDGRRRQVGDVLARLPEDELETIRTAAPAPAWGEESHSVRSCLGVVMDEHVEHRRYTERDLTALEARRSE